MPCPWATTNSLRVPSPISGIIHHPMTTPMMKQWQAAKDQHTDGILFFRMGDFFEFFHDDARRAADLLGLTLTTRTKKNGGIPMAGIPVRSLDRYVRTLVTRGEKVVICDQMEDPSEAKGIVAREVTRIVTPGTLTDVGALEACSNNYLASLQQTEAGWGLSWVDVSTGEFCLQTVDESYLVDTICSLEPAECLLPDEEMDGPGARFDAATLEGCVITRRPSFSFDAELAVRNLAEHFGTLTLEGFGVDATEPALGAAGALLEYLSETQRGAIGQVTRIQKVTDGRTMVLDRTTRSSLELVRTLRGEGRSGTLLSVLDRCVTAMGSRLLKGWLLRPLIDADAIRARQNAVGEFRENRELASAVRSELRDILDVERLAAQVGCERANPRDLVALRASLLALPRLSRLLSQCGSKLLGSIIDDLPDLSGLAAELVERLADEPPSLITEGGVIREGFHEELDQLRRLKGEGKGFIAAFQQSESESTGISSLKVGYNRVFGYYLEVTNTHKDRVPDQWIRKQTLKNAERYITPQLKEYEDRVLHAEEHQKALELELFCDLRRKAMGHLPSIQAAARCLAQLDVLQGLALASSDGDWVRPEIAADDCFSVTEGRHPVVCSQSSGDVFVPNDVDLGDDRRVMLITGPNMAGKSTYIRQVALLSIMAQLGSDLPATAARVGIVDRVFTRVGASDDLARGASTFMVEMLEVANILNSATSRSLVILDEVGRGTSTYDGLSLAWSITEHLATEIRAKTLFATHYHELCELAEALPTVFNFNVAVREWQDEILFLHKIIPGSADRSYGLHVARLAGLPAELLKDAQVVLDRLENAESVPRAPRQPVEYQPSLFDAVPDRLREALDAVDPERTTPMDALAILTRLKKL